jgi:type II secretory pathway pseudopilin PulG
MVNRLRSESGFSLVELLFATGLLLVVSSIVTTALMQMTQQQQTIWNRTEMHSGIRGATELLQQEVGQAGRATLPGSGVVTITANGFTGLPASAVACTSKTVTVSSTAGMWGSASTGIALTFLNGDNQETVRVTAVAGNDITGCFWKDHPNGTPIMALGGFGTGILPPTGFANGSSADVLKMYGDINGDGNMVYVEYKCDVANGKLYRNVMPWDTAPADKPALNDSKILLSNIIANPGGTPCFTYQTSTIPIDSTIPATSFTFVLDVAITLTVETQQIDPITKLKQTETKALLNVSPRNVFHAWSFAGLSYTDRIQSTPATIEALIAIAP